MSGKLCHNCGWWCEIDQTKLPKDFRLCVLLTGLLGESTQPMHCQRGPIWTREDFGCPKWEARQPAEE